jgi:hypothetical protein
MVYNNLTNFGLLNNSMLQPKYGGLLRQMPFVNYNEQFGPEEYNYNDFGTGEFLAEMPINEPVMANEPITQQPSANIIQSNQKEFDPVRNQMQALMSTMTEKPQGLLGYLQSPATLGFASGLLKSSGYSATPVTMGAALGAGIDGAQNFASEDLNRKAKILNAYRDYNWSMGGGVGNSVFAQSYMLLKNAREQQLGRPLTPDEDIQIQMVARNGLQKGVGFNEGQIAPIAGAEQASAAMAYAPERAEQTARTEQSFQQEALGGMGKEFSEKVGKSASVIRSADYAVNTIDSIIGAPGFESNFGISSWLPNIPGLAAADSSAMLEQLGGQTFLQAYNDLRGGGQITEAEGQKATQALINLKAAQSADQVRENLLILRDFIGKIRSGAMQMQQQGQQFREKYVPELTPQQNNSTGIKFLGFE